MRAENYNIIFLLIVVTTWGSWGADSKNLVYDLEQRNRENGKEFSICSLLVHRLSIGIQFGIAASLMGLLPLRQVQSGRNYLITFV